MDTRRFTKWLLAALLILAGCTSDDDGAVDLDDGAVACLPGFESGWIRAGKTAMPMMMGGFGRIENDCGQGTAVVAASSAQFDDVSLHRTTGEGGISRMRPVPRLEVAPGASVVLEPGGLHLMLMQPRQPLREGDTVSVTLMLEDGRALPAELVLQTSAP